MSKESEMRKLTTIHIEHSIQKDNHGYTSTSEPTETPLSASSVGSLETTLGTTQLGNSYS